MVEELALEKGPRLNSSRSRTLEAFLNARKGLLPFSRVISFLLGFYFVFCTGFILLCAGQSLGLPASLSATGVSHMLIPILFIPHSFFSASDAAVSYTTPQTSPPSSALQLLLRRKELQSALPAWGEQGYSFPESQRWTRSRNPFMAFRKTSKLPETPFIRR